MLAGTAVNKRVGLIRRRAVGTEAVRCVRDRIRESFQECSKSAGSGSATTIASGMPTIARFAEYLNHPIAPPRNLNQAPCSSPEPLPAGLAHLAIASQPDSAASDAAPSMQHNPKTTTPRMPLM